MGLLTNWTELSSTEDVSSSLKNQRPEEDPAPAPDLDPGLDPDPGPVAAQDLAEAVTKEVAPNLGAVADHLHPKTAQGAVQGQDLATRMMTERMEIALKRSRSRSRRSISKPIKIRKSNERWRLKRIARISRDQKNSAIVFETKRTQQSSDQF